MSSHRTSMAVPHAQLCIRIFTLVSTTRVTCAGEPNLHHSSSSAKWPPLLLPVCACQSSREEALPLNLAALLTGSD